MNPEGSSGIRLVLHLVLDLESYLGREGQERAGLGPSLGLGLGPGLDPGHSPLDRGVSFL